MAAGLRPASRPRTVGKPRRSDASTRRQAGWLEWVPARSRGSSSPRHRSGLSRYDSRRKDMSLRARTVPISSPGTSPFRIGRSRLPYPLVGRNHGEFMGSVTRRELLIGGSRLIARTGCVRPDASARRPTTPTRAAQPYALTHTAVVDLEGRQSKGRFRYWLRQVGAFDAKPCFHR